MNISKIGYILEVDVEYSKKLFNLHSVLPFLSERKRMENGISLLVTCMTKKTMLCTEEL